MNLLFQAALEARTVIAAPLRSVTMARLRQQQAAPLLVPFYHRVANQHCNDWTISQRDFLRHVDYCQQHCELIDLAEIQRRVQSGISPQTAVSFTFDDGYAENCDFALPLLVERQIPCTYFVTTAHVRNQHPFPHDVQAGVALAVNTVRQLRELSQAGIEIGLHTRNHVDFSRLHRASDVRREIVEAKDELEQMIGKAVRYFAFPFGLPPQLTRLAIETVYEAGLWGFCSAFGGYNLIGRDAFHLRRFHGDREFARFRNWLSYDPSKTKREPQVDYTLPEVGTPLRNQTSRK